MAFGDEGAAPLTAPTENPIRFALYNPERGRSLRWVRQGRSTWADHTRSFGVEYFLTSNFFDDARPNPLPNQSCREDKKVTAVTFRRALRSDNLPFYEIAYDFPILLFPTWDRKAKKVRWVESEFSSFGSVTTGMLSNAAFNGNSLRSALTNIKEPVASLKFERRDVWDIAGYAGPDINPARAADAANAFSAEMGWRGVDFFNNAKWKVKVRQPDGTWVVRDENLGNLYALEVFQVEQFSQEPHQRDRRILSYREELDSWIAKPYTLSTLEEYAATAAARGVLYGDCFLVNGDWQQCYGRIPTYNRYRKGYDARAKNLPELRVDLSLDNFILLDVMLKEYFPVDLAIFEINPPGRPATFAERLLSDAEKYQILRRKNFEAMYPEWAATLPMGIDEYLAHRQGQRGVTGYTFQYRGRTIDLRIPSSRLEYLGDSPKEHSYLVRAWLLGALHAVADWILLLRAHEQILAQEWNRTTFWSRIYSERYAMYAYSPDYRLVQGQMTNADLEDKHLGAIINPDRDLAIRPLLWVADVQQVWMQAIRELGLVQDSNRLGLDWGRLDTAYKSGFPRGTGARDIEFELIDSLIELIVVSTMFTRDYAYIEVQNTFKFLRGNVKFLSQWVLNDILARKKFEVGVRDALTPKSGPSKLVKMTPRELESYIEEKVQTSPVLRRASDLVANELIDRFKLDKKRSLLERLSDKARRGNLGQYNIRATWSGKDEWRDYFTGFLEEILGRWVDPVTSKSFVELFVEPTLAKTELYYEPTLEQILKFAQGQPWFDLPLPRGVRIEPVEELQALPKMEERL